MHKFRFIQSATKALGIGGNLQHKLSTWDPFLMQAAEIKNANLLRKEKVCT